MAMQPQIRNGILAALPATEIESLRPHLSHVTLVSGQVLHEADSSITDVYFMNSGVASLTATTNGSDQQVEVGLTGREGLVGTSVVLSPEPYAVHRAFIQVPGEAYRINASAFCSALDRSATLRNRCLRHIEFSMVQTSQ